MSVALLGSTIVLKRMYVSKYSLINLGVRHMHKIKTRKVSKIERLKECIINKVRKNFLIVDFF